MIRKLLIGLIRLYQKAISPLFPPSCRFYPTCSTYAVQALERRGRAGAGWPCGASANATRGIRAATIRWSKRFSDTGAADDCLIS